MRKKESVPTLTGKTLLVYRYLYKSGKALGVREIQRGLEFSSPSVAEYHLNKLLAMGLIKEDQGKFSVDQIIFENMIRIRTSLIPFQLAYLVFFATALVILVLVFRPHVLSEGYVFSLAILFVACVIFAMQTTTMLRNNRI